MTPAADAVQQRFISCIYTCTEPCRLQPPVGDMASEPLLNGQDTGTDTLLEAQYLSEEQPDFVQVIAHDPEGVIAYIEQKGVQDLGTFKVQVPTSHSPCSE